MIGSSVCGSGRSNRASRLFFEDFFYLADLLLQLPGDLFVLACGFQVGIVRQLSDFFFELALQIVEHTFGLVLRASIHRKRLLGVADAA